MYYLLILLYEKGFSEAKHGLVTSKYTCRYKISIPHLSPQIVLLELSSFSI